MLNAITESLPIALGILVATLPAVAIPLILLTRRETRILLGFLGGWVLGFVLLGGLVIVTADLMKPNPEGPPVWMVRLRLLLGVALFSSPRRNGAPDRLPGRTPNFPAGWRPSIRSTRGGRWVSVSCWSS